MMKYFTVDALRRSFLDFFLLKDHKEVPSAPLVPHGDPTLLLTGAGMVPFKSHFLGHTTPSYPRITSCQRCLRTPDIENVGKTDRHGTFFEMLGNFSFGNYFKEEVIPWAYEYVLHYLEFPADRLWVSVYLEDDQAYQIWTEKVGIPKERMVRLGKKDNFWEIGVGPCGPCSELYIDRGSEHGCGDEACKPGCDCERYLEFWNLVFIQFHQDEKGNLTPLAAPGIDTGLGMERVAALSQGKKSIFETDLMFPILEMVANLAHTEYGNDPEKDVSLRVVADHLRGITFLVHDGVLPSNEGRGYVLRRLLRRAVRHGRLLGIEDAFLQQGVDVVIGQMKVGYPEVLENSEYIKKVIGLEEDRFHETLDSGMALLQEMMEKSTTKEITGADAFRLYDTFGFPFELTKEIAEEKGFTVDDLGFQTSMQAQRQRARQARAETSYLGDSVDVYKNLKEQLEVTFRGYEVTELETHVVALLREDIRVDSLSQGDTGVVVLEITPFYAESGGQVADIGSITSTSGSFEVKDVKRPVEGIVTQVGTMTQGSLQVGDTVSACVYDTSRQDTNRHHTATHLLHKAIKDVVGDHANQAGSYVSPERLRFDFTHFEALRPEELARIEEQVNAQIRRNLPVGTLETQMKEAKELGAMALFGEKYGETVRVVQISDYSLELCGGTHARATGDLGVFRIVAEGSVAAGIRRIEAVAGKPALDYIQRREQALLQACGRLSVQPEELPQAVDKLRETQRELEKQLQVFKKQATGTLAQDLKTSAEKVLGVSLVIAEVPLQDMEELRSLGDALRDSLAPAVVFLASAQGDKVSLLGMASKDVAGKKVHVGNAIKEVAKLCGGGGGGRPDMAQAGGKDPSKIAEALGLAREIFTKQIEGNT